MSKMTVEEMTLLKRAIKEAMGLSGLSVKVSYWLGRNLEKVSAQTKVWERTVVEGIFKKYATPPAAQVYLPFEAYQHVKEEILKMGEGATAKDALAVILLQEYRMPLSVKKIVLPERQEAYFEEIKAASEGLTYEVELTKVGLDLKDEEVLRKLPAKYLHALHQILNEVSLVKVVPGGAFGL